MSRFAVDPRWLVYLPPTMAPTATSQRAGRARAPGRGVRRVPRGRASPRSCARRSTWARGRSRSSAATRDGSERFGIEGTGALYTRTGRPFLDDAEPALERIRAAVDRAPACGSTLETDWLVLDCELLPWSAKARS